MCSPSYLAALDFRLHLLLQVSRNTSRVSQGWGLYWLALTFETIHASQRQLAIHASRGTSRLTTHGGRRMIERNVKDDFQASPMSLPNQKFKVLHGTKDRVDLAIVCDIVPILI